VVSTLVSGPSGPGRSPGRRPHGLTIYLVYISEFQFQFFTTLTPHLLSLQYHATYYVEHLFVIICYKLYYLEELRVMLITDLCVVHFEAGSKSFNPFALQSGPGPGQTRVKLTWIKCFPQFRLTIYFVALCWVRVCACAALVWRDELRTRACKCVCMRECMYKYVCEHMCVWVYVCNVCMFECCIPCIWFYYQCIFFYSYFLIGSWKGQLFVMYMDE
jgi:hypothetical protein